MQLLPCNKPTGPLETAPRTSLRADSALETWAGFWNLDDEGYYTRCVYADGSEAWFHLVDELPRDEKFESRGRVIKFYSSRARADIVSMRLMGIASGRPILVGTSRRRARTGGVRS